MLTLSPPVEFVYWRDTVAINANVVEATHGETHDEVIGAGDSSKEFQRFALKKPPLTLLPAPTPQGTEDTLTVRVNDVEWEERDNLNSSDTR